MLRVHQLVLTLDNAPSYDESMLRRLCAGRLRIPEDRIAAVRLAKRSVDARGKGGVHFSLTADVLLTDAKAEAALAKKFRPNEAALVPGRPDDPVPDVTEMRLQPWPKGKPAPVVAGAGPAGLFCALALAARGAKPVLVERGKPVGERAKDIGLLETEGLLNEESNVLFGEGGAGAFSDGKLTCGVNSPHIRTVLQTLVNCGAPEDILTAAKPHIGTDELRGVLRNAREKLLALGAEIFFETKLTGLVLKDGRVTGARVLRGGSETVIPCDTVCLAVGHSARDTCRMLYELGLPMKQKPFAAGVRIEHPQSLINRAQYGASAGHPALPPAEYKLNVPTRDGRGVYTFCMCPGGRVINASSEAGGLNVNGMSLHARDGANANAAVLVGVRPEDFGSDHPLAGVEWQRRIERAAFACTGSMTAPCQRVGDFLADRKTTAFGEVLPSYRPGVAFCRMDDFLPDFVAADLRAALPALGGRLRGFDLPDALLTGPETRSSSPVRMERNERRESPVAGVFPLGEGAGYAGGIVSAAVDGLCAGTEIGTEAEA